MKLKTQVQIQSKRNKFDVQVKATVKKINLNISVWMSGKYVAHLMIKWLTAVFHLTHTFYPDLLSTHKKMRANRSTKKGHTSLLTTQR